MIPITHKELVQIAYKWLLNRQPTCGVAFRELVSVNREIPDAIGFTSWTSILVECKVSRADFLKDKKKAHRLTGKGMGRHRYYMCPAGLIKKEEVPEGWGLLYVTEKRRVMVHHCPYSKTAESNILHGGFERDLHAENQLMYTALRRLHIRNRIEEIYNSDLV